jgi:acyl-CoA reductase-like NAD-dependent aldehyde dehydrogenase
VGVVGAIVPWNAPNSLVVQKTAAALIAGCTVIVKGSPEAPSSPYLLAEVCEEVGLPAGVVNVVTADREVSERLVPDRKSPRGRWSNGGRRTTGARGRTRGG